jgi:hypothetical protein
MAKNYNHLQGWYKNEIEVFKTMETLPFPVVSDIYNPIKDSGRGKKRLLYEAVQNLLGTFLVQVQTIGDCTSFMFAHLCNTLKAIQAITTEMEEFTLEHLTSTEDVYAGSRIQIGNGACGYGDGSVGAWIAKYVSTYGTLCRKKYENIDLSIYDGNKARTWGQPGHGTPSILLPYAKEHTVKTVSQVGSYEEARDLLYNGHLIGVCSQQGFSDTRDKDGFATPQGDWSHAMAVLAIDDEYRRPGVLIQNSWPINWITGPKRYNQPDGSFWCDADIFNAMVKMNDTFAYSAFEGFPVQDLDWKIV